MYCKFCGNRIDDDCAVCPECGKQLKELKTETPNVVINNQISEPQKVVVYSKIVNKWVALVLCIVLGMFGAHKFYEKRAKIGLVYLFTLGLFGVGWLMDILLIALKPNPYYV